MIRIIPGANLFFYYLLSGIKFDVAFHFWDRIWRWTYLEGFLEYIRTRGLWDHLLPSSKRSYLNWEQRCPY